MEKKDLIRKNVFFWVDTITVAISLVWTAYYLQDICDGLSFGGFGALFLLLVLCPYFLAVGAALLLLIMAERKGRRLLAGIAAGLQILSPIPWILLSYAFGYTTLSPYEVMMVVCGGAGVFLLLSLPAVRPTKNGM